MTLSRRAFIGVAAGATPLAGGLALWRVGHGAPRVRRFEFALPDLPKDLDGLRVLLVSDLHVGPYLDREALDGLARRIVGVEPDLLVVAGDMVDGHATPSDALDFVQAFEGIRPRYGTFAVLGNHEYFAGVDMVLEALEGSRVRLLRGDVHVIESGKGGLALLGVDDPRGPGFDPPQDVAVSRVAAAAPDGVARVLIAHRPAAFDAAARLGIPLTLSGHTHGGQVGLPLRSLTPIRLATPYVRGHYGAGSAHLVVSSGIGMSGLPVRVGVPPTMELLTLRRESSA